MERLLSKDLDNERRLVLSEECIIQPVQDYQPSRGMVGAPEILEFTGIVITNIGCGLLASWLYDLIKNRRIQAEINGRELPENKDELESEIISIINAEDDATCP